MPHVPARMRVEFKFKVAENTGPSSLKNLKQFFTTTEPKTFNYKIQSINRKDIDNLKEILKKNPDILNIDINYAR